VVEIEPAGAVSCDQPAEVSARRLELLGLMFLGDHGNGHGGVIASAVAARLAPGALADAERPR